MILISYAFECFYHLHSMAKFKIGCVKQVVDEDSNFDFFSRLPTQMIQQKNLILKCYQVNNEKIKVLLMVKKT